MSNYEIVSKVVVSNSEVLEEIQKKEADRELTYREDKVRVFLKDEVKLSLDEVKKAIEELLGLGIHLLDEVHAIKLIDLMPKTGTEIRVIVSHSGTVIVDEDVTRVLEVLNKYRK